MVYSINYRRPAYVDSARASFQGDEKPKSIGGSTLNSQGSAGPIQGIPEALSFDRIMAGGTCPVSESTHHWDQAEVEANNVIALHHT